MIGDLIIYPLAVDDLVISGSNNEGRIVQNIQAFEVAGGKIGTVAEVQMVAAWCLYRECFEVDEAVHEIFVGSVIVEIEDCDTGPFAAQDGDSLICVAWDAAFELVPFCDCW